MRVATFLCLAAISALGLAALAQNAPAPAGGEYKVLKKVPVGGQGGFDYCFADADGRKLYIPRGNRVDVFDLDTLKPAGTIDQTSGVHGAAVDTKTNHGFCSSNPIVMWDTTTLKTIKTIPAPAGARPDGILFDPFTQHVMILSHQEPNVTVIDTKDGNLLGTINLTGQPEQGASDGNGKLYICLEDQSKVAVVDSKAMKLLTTYDLQGKTGSPAGMAMDTKNHILFVSGRTPAACVIMNADDGKIITTLPIGSGVDASEFNPATMEAFISSGDGKLTVIKETDPKTFSVEQTVTTVQGARTSTLDAKTGDILLVTSDPSVPPATAPGGAATAPANPPEAAAGPGGGGGFGGGGPGGGGFGGRRGGFGGRGRGQAGTFSVIVVGKETH